MLPVQGCKHARCQATCTEHSNDANVPCAAHHTRTHHNHHHQHTSQNNSKPVGMHLCFLHGQSNAFRDAPNSLLVQICTHNTTLGFKGAHVGHCATTVCRERKQFEASQLPCPPHAASASCKGPQGTPSAHLAISWFLISKH